MKKILVLNYEFPPLGGGASPVTYELAKRLSETGDYDIDVVTMGYKDLPKYEEINAHLRVHRVKSWRSKKEICHPWEQLTYLVSGYFKCKELLAKNTYDVCHTHFIIPTGVLALKLKKKFGLEYVITSHGSDVLGYNKRFKHLYPLLVTQWKKILDNAKTITTPSNFLKGEILKIYPTVEEKIVVIPNGIDTNKFTPQSKKNYIFSSGRLLVNKGFQYLIQAVSDEDLGWEVHIAGDGVYADELKHLTANSKTKIVFHGWLNNNEQEYKNLLEQAAIYVLMSEKESFGMVFAEAMSAGCAIVAADTPTSREVVDQAGLYSRVGDKENLKQLLTQFIRDEEILKQAQSKAVEKAKVFDWKEVIKKYFSVLS